MGVALANRPSGLASDIRTVQELLRHTDRSTTMTYTHVLGRGWAEPCALRHTGCCQSATAPGELSIRPLRSARGILMSRSCLVIFRALSAWATQDKSHADLSPHQRKSLMSGELEVAYYFPGPLYTRPDRTSSIETRQQVW